MPMLTTLGSFKWFLKWKVKSIQATINIRINYIISFKLFWKSAGRTKPTWRLLKESRPMWKDLINFRAELRTSRKYIARRLVETLENSQAAGAIHPKMKKCFNLISQMPSMLGMWKMMNKFLKVPPSMTI